MEITKQEYENAKSIIKLYELQEYKKLDYEIGIIRVRSGWRPARRVKKTGEVFVAYNNIYDKNTSPQFILAQNPDLIASFEEDKG